MSNFLEQWELEDRHYELNDPIHEALGAFPKRPPRPKEEAQLLENARQMRGESMAFQPLVRARLADIADTRDETRQARGTANADVMQQVRGGTPFDRAMVRGKALSRVALQGQLQVEQQNLRDRVGMVRFGQGVRSGNSRELGALGNLSAEQTASRMRSEQTSSAANANAFGTLGGIAAAYFRNRGTGASQSDVMREQNVGGVAGAI